jgi:hypothetical protein
MIAGLLACLTPCLAALAVVVVVESGRPDRTTDLPSRAAWRAALADAVARARAALADDRPRSAREYLEELLFVLFAPAATVRALLHVGGAVVANGGRDPGEIDVGLRARSPVVELDRWTDLRIRVGVACYAGFWALYGTTALDPAGKIYFAAQLGLLIIDPALWSWRWVLSPSRPGRSTTSSSSPAFSHGD